jgi:membrane protein DedA with SNARE-associated domain
MEEFFTNIMEHHSYLAYLILFVWSMAEGETGLVLAVILVYTGHMLLFPAILIAGLGGAAGDLLFFHLGKYHSDVVKDKIKNNEIIIDEIKKLLKKHDIIVIFIQRYLYGLRTIIPIVIGMSQYDEKRFFSINLFSAFI